MKKVGVIVGRFQVPKLHRGHRYLIDTVQRSCDQILIILGSTKIVSSRDPFSTETRKTMIQADYPHLQLAEIEDRSSDEKWSKKLDQIISNFFPDATVTLYGSRESFLAKYTGSFRTVYLPPIQAPSGTDIRKKIFRKGKRAI